MLFILVTTGFAAVAFGVTALATPAARMALAGVGGFVAVKGAE